jgi:hypothetical protein
MFSRPILCASTLILASASACAQQLPALDGTALSGDRVMFPDALRGHASVLIVSFSQSARDNVTAWYRRVNSDFKSSPAVLYYEMPMLGGAPGFLRGAIVKKIKQDVAAPAQPHFVPVLDHEDQWKTVCGWSKQLPEDHTYILLVDGTGQVRFHAEYAAPTDQSYADLKQRLLALKP